MLCHIWERVVIAILVTYLHEQPVALYIPDDGQVPTSSWCHRHFVTSSSNLFSMAQFIRLALYIPYNLPRLMHTE